VISTALLVLALTITQSPMDDLPRIETRFGTLAVNKDRMLLFKGKPLSPSVQGNSSLDLGTPFRIGATDVVLVTDNGGAACPVLYYFVTVSKSGAKHTPVFGTCEQLSSIKRSGNSILVRMRGFRGPFEPEADRRRAAMQRHLFIFSNGVVTENGKPVKG
jgi:hypothetical protein